MTLREAVGSRALPLLPSPARSKELILGETLSTAVATLPTGRPSLQHSPTAPALLPGLPGLLGQHRAATV